MTKARKKTELQKISKELQQPAAKAPVKGTYYHLLIKLSELQAGIPSNLLDNKTKKQLARANMEMAQTHGVILKIKYLISETLYVLHERVTAFANNKGTYDTHRSKTQEMIPLSDTGKTLAGERNNLKEKIDELIRIFYNRTREIGKYGLAELDKGKNLPEVKKLVRSQLTELFNSAEKERKNLQASAEKLGMNEGALQKKLNALELETRHISIAAGIKVQPAPSSSEHLTR